MIKALQRRFALSRQGAVDLIKGCIACVVQDISFMIPVGLLYTFVMDMMNGGVNEEPHCFLCGGCFGLSVLHFHCNLFSIQRHLSGNLCGKRGKAHFSGRTASQNPALLFREKGPCRFDKLHHGRLRHAGNGVFPLCARFGRLSHFHNPDCRFAFLPMTGAWPLRRFGFCRLPSPLHFSRPAYRNISTGNPWRQMSPWKAVCRSALKACRT